MAEAEPFLSAAWYRVRHLRPRLREHAEVRLHRYRGAPWYVLTDPLAGRVHRLAPPAWALIAALDGTSTVDEVWTEISATQGEAALGQDQVIALLGQLHAADLLQGDAPPDTHEIFERHGRLARRKLTQNLLNPMALRFRLWNPDRFLTRLLPLVGPLFSRWGFALWLALVGSASVLVAQHWPDLTAHLGDRVLAEGNLLLLAVILPAIKLLHELGHGFAVRRRGGAVHDMGVMFLVLLPLPYIDASAASGFRSRWDRVVVGAAGMMVELAIGALATFAWVAIEPGLARSIAFNVMLAAGATTILFNANPLLRYDGYYMLADAIEIPNLAQRATQYWGQLVETHIFATPPQQAHPHTPGERAWFLFYAPAAWLYRQAVMLSIALFLAGEYFTIGMALALWTLGTGLVLPMAKMLRHVVASPRLRRHRARAVGLTFGAIAGLAALLLLVPAPLHTSAQGVVWLPEAAIVRAGADGVVTRLLAIPGTALAPGDAVSESEDPFLAARLARARARVAEFEARLPAERFTNRVEAAITETELAQARAELAHEQRRQANLVARAAGTLAIARPADLPGRYLKEGEIVAYALPADGPRIIRAAIAQDDIDLVRSRLLSVQVKLAGHLADALPARLVREVPGGRDELPSRALATTGGGAFAPHPRDPDGLRTLARVFQVDIELPPGAPAEAFGARAHIRFEHAWEPLGDQLWRRLRQLLLTRLQA
jgi:putative peptide zinc metalloprotease protein